MSQAKARDAESPIIQRLEPDFIGDFRRKFAIPTVQGGSKSHSNHDLLERALCSGDPATCQPNEQNKSLNWRAKRRKSEPRESSHAPTGFRAPRCSEGCVFIQPIRYHSSTVDGVVL